MTDEIRTLPSDSPLKEALLDALADDYSRNIMNYTIEQPRSVIDIVKELDIPMTTAYRRVNDLTDKKILKITGSVVTDDGKKYFLYQCKIKATYVVFGLEELNVQIVDNIGFTNSAFW